MRETMSAITKGGEFEKLPKIASATSKDANLNHSSHDCIVPFIEKKSVDENKSKDNRLRKFDNYLPDDLILSLKQAEQPKEYLGPPSKKTLAAIKPNIPSITKRPDNAWNHEKQREKFKFLTDQPICSCGAGKDLTFLYDSVNHEKPSNKPQVSKYDLSSIRLSDTSTQLAVKEEVDLPDSLIPEEFKVVTNQGVAPLTIDKNQYSTVTDDHTNHLTAFPSLKPTSRYEVIQLKHTMEALLKRIGADIIDQKGPTQLHNLLEIIKQEQDIYNIVFHEVIRQVTVECKERGEILAKLRERYANLLSRVPREIKSLHEEIIAQRALDRRLTEELLQFKTMVAFLTEELAKVREHDKKIGEQADIYKNDLQKALSDAEKNASLLTEYHDLYELQRKRLEKTIDMLIEERNLWIRTSYGISIKVCEENKLNNCKRINIAEKSWFKLAKHFSLMISDKDTKDLMAIQQMIETWKSTMEEARVEINEKEVRFRRSLETTKVDLNSMKIFFQESCPIDVNGKFENLPDPKQVTTLLIQMKKILENSMRQLEDFNGDAVLISEDKLKKGERIVYTLIQISNTLINRHEPSKDLKKMDEYMRYEQIQQEAKQLQEQYRIQTSGDNGLSRNMATFVNGLDVWVQKLTSAQFSNSNNNNGNAAKNTNKNKLGEQEWAALYQSFDEWFDFLDKTYESIGLPVKDVTDSKPSESTLDTVSEPTIIDHDNLINEMNSWLKNFTHFIDSQDAFLVEEVHVYHTKMVHWVVQVLIRLARDREELSDEARKMIYGTTSTVENLEKIAIHLGDRLEKFTNSLADRSNSIVTHEENNRKPNEPSNYEKELTNIRNLQNDLQEWRYIAKILVAELNGDKSYRKSIIGRRLSGLSGSIRENDIQSDVEEEEDDAKTKSDDVLRDEIKSPENQEVKGKNSVENVENNENIENEENNEAENTESVAENNENADETVENKNNQNNQNVENVEEDEEDEGLADENPISMDTTMFEIINKEANTERKFLENINFEDSNQLSEIELKSTVFNAFKTIEKLQTDLLKTEERAQKSEEKVAELELQLKDALTKIREFEH